MTRSRIILALAALSVLAVAVPAMADHIPGRPCSNCASHEYWPTIHGRLAKANNGQAATFHGTRRSDELLGHHGSDSLYGRGRSDVLWGDWQGGADQPTNQRDRIYGGGGDDFIYGSHGRNVIYGGPGNDAISGDANDTGDRTSFDRINGGAGDDAIHGGDSRDRLNGDSGNDTIFGENGNDRMSGGSGNDNQSGGAGNDVISAGAGVDVSSGGGGNDTLWALARTDVTPGPGGAVDQVGDTLDGGGGNDTFRTRDGEVDRITCGPGDDRAILDTVDVITDATAAGPNGSCEHVQRKAPSTHGAKNDSDGS